MNLIEKIAVGLGILAGVYLVLNNPQGTSVAANSLTAGIVSVDKTAQGR